MHVESDRTAGLPTFGRRFYLDSLARLMNLIAQVKARADVILQLRDKKTREVDQFARLV